jgi:hypothetical protein
MSLESELQRLIIRLHDADSDTRGKTVVALREHTEVPEVQHALRSAIYDSSGYVRMLAAEALARAALFPEDVIPVLIAVLEVADRSDIAEIEVSKQWRRVAAGVIGKYSSGAAPAIPALRNALLDPDVNIRGYAAQSLGEIGPAALVALQDLRAARQSEADEEVRKVYETAIKKVVQSEDFIAISKMETPGEDSGASRFN